MRRKKLNKKPQQKYEVHGTSREEMLRVQLLKNLLGYQKRNFSFWKLTIGQVNVMNPSLAKIAQAINELKPWDTTIHLTISQPKKRTDPLVFKIRRIK